jgi:hypothetical protein
MERPVAHALEGMQQPQGDHLTGPEVGLSGCLGRACICSSTPENKAVINSTVVIRLSSQGKDVTQTSVEESSDACKPKSVHR